MVKKDYDSPLTAFDFFLHFPCKESKTSYATSTTISVKNNDVKSPPIVAIAIGALVFRAFADPDGPYSNLRLKPGC
jgi:hypothetical protein